MWIQRLATALTVAGALFTTAAAHAEAPDAMVKQVSNEVIEAVKSDKAVQAGDVQRINALVDDKVMPHVNFQRMTSSAVGRYWRTASPDQQKRLQDEFKILLIRTYAGALTQVRDKTTVQLKPMRAQATDNEVVVRTEVHNSSGEPIQLDYRLEKAADSWRVYDINVGGIWLVEQYRNSFAQEIGANGVDGLIAKLAEKNKAAGSKLTAPKS
jgi:phospholipid transport system substrate-binding protein